MLGRRGRAMPGSWGLAAIGKKSCRSSPHTTTSIFWGGLDFIFSWYAGQAGLCRAGSPIFFLGRIPTLARLQCRAGAAGLCRAGAAGWRNAKPYDRMIRMIRMTRRVREEHVHPTCTPTC